MSATAAEPRAALVEGLMERFPHVPREAVIKRLVEILGFGHEQSF